MKTFEVDLNFIDKDNDLITKTIELKFVSQRFINRATELFSKMIQLTTLQQLRNQEPEFRAKIEVEYKGAEKIEALNNMRINLKEAKKTMEELATFDLYKEKLTLIMDILKKNNVQGMRYYDFDFWDECVDPQEIQEFLESIISRGKKKELEKSLKINLKPATESKKNQESTI